MYESWFQFTDRPFGSAPQVRSYFAASAIEAARANIVACIERGAGPALAVGTTGSGKTMLGLILRQEFNHRMPVALLNATSCPTPRALLQNLLHASGQPYADMDDGQLRLSLTEFLNAHSDTGGSLLILDAASHLQQGELDELRGLTNLTGDNGWCLHLVLIGDPQLEETLGLPGLSSLNQRVTTRCYLDSWSPADTTGYIETELSRVGRAASEILEPDAVATIHRLTDGIPRLVAQLTDHALVLSSLGGKSVIPACAVEEAWADLQQLPARVVYEHVESAVEAGSEIEFGSLDEGEGFDSFSGLEGSSAVLEDPNESNDAGEFEDSPVLEFEDSMDSMEAAEAADSVDAVDQIDEVQNAIDVIQTMDQFAPESSDVAETHEAEDVDAILEFSDPHSDPHSDAGLEAPHQPGSEAGSPIVESVDQPIATGEFQLDANHVQSAASDNPFLEYFEEEEVVFAKSLPIFCGNVAQRNTVDTDEGHFVSSVVKDLAQVQSDVQPTISLPFAEADPPTQRDCEGGEGGALTVLDESLPVEDVESVAVEHYESQAISFATTRGDEIPFGDGFGEGSAEGEGDTMMPFGSAVISAGTPDEFSEEEGSFPPIVTGTYDVGTDAGDSQAADREPSVVENSGHAEVDSLEIPTAGRNIETAERSADGGELCAAESPDCGDGPPHANRVRPPEPDVELHPDYDRKPTKSESLSDEDRSNPRPRKLRFSRLFSRLSEQ